MGGILLAALILVGVVGVVAMRGWWAGSVGCIQALGYRPRMRFEDGGAELVEVEGRRRMNDHRSP
jgi:hypothetical protein